MTQLTDREITELVAASCDLFIRGEWHEEFGGFWDEDDWSFHPLHDTDDFLRVLALSPLPLRFHSSADGTRSLTVVGTTVILSRLPSVLQRQVITTLADAVKGRTSLT